MEDSAAVKPIAGWVVEYARRKARCRACNTDVLHGELRIGRRARSQFGLYMRYFHLRYRIPATSYACACQCPVLKIDSFCTKGTLPSPRAFGTRSGPYGP
eukprot:3629787-Rhodomonas_salina.1